VPFVAAFMCLVHAYIFDWLTVGLSGKFHMAGFITSAEIYVCSVALNTVRVQCSAVHNT